MYYCYTAVHCAVYWVQYSAVRVLLYLCPFPLKCSGEFIEYKLYNRVSQKTWEYRDDFKIVLDVKLFKNKEILTFNKRILFFLSYPTLSKRQQFLVLSENWLRWFWIEFFSKLFQTFSKFAAILVLFPKENNAQFWFKTSDGTNLRLSNVGQYKSRTNTNVGLIQTTESTSVALNEYKLRTKGKFYSNYKIIFLKSAIFSLQNLQSHKVWGY